MTLDMRTVPVEAVRQAISEYPNEMCGVVVGGEYIPCRNISDNPTFHFVVHNDDYQAALVKGPVEAVIHSHCDHTSAPSEADLQGCAESDVPWAILEVRAGKYIGHRWIEPDKWQAPLLNRPFYHGVHDCLSIILDYYSREMGIDLGQFDREDDWWNNGKDYYRELLPKAGFSKIDPEVDGYRSGDVILMQIRSPVPNHAAIFLEDGKLLSETCANPAPCVILHHMYGQLSRRDVYGGYYLEKTVSVWRYGSSR